MLVPSPAARVAATLRRVHVTTIASRLLLICAEWTTISRPMSSESCALGLPAARSGYSLPANLGRGRMMKMLAAAVLTSALALPAAAQPQPEALNMRLVGYSDLQTRSAYQP